MDFVAGFLEIVGLYLVGKKCRWGFIFNVIGCIIWIFISVQKPVYGLLVVVCPAVVLNLINFKKWSEKKPPKEFDVFPLGGGMEHETNNERTNL